MVLFFSGRRRTVSSAGNQGASASAGHVSRRQPMGGGPARLVHARVYWVRVGAAEGVAANGSAVESASGGISQWAPSLASGTG